MKRKIAFAGHSKANQKNSTNVSHEMKRKRLTDENTEPNRNLPLKNPKKDGFDLLKSGEKVIIRSNFERLN